MKHFILFITVAMFPIFAGAASATVIFVHGTPADGSQFSRYVHSPELLAKAKLIAEDRPGFGTQTNPNHMFGFKEQVEAVLGSVNQAEGEVTLVGYSYGAAVALSAASQATDKIRNLVLVGMPMNPALIEMPSLLRPLRWPRAHAIYPSVLIQAYFEIQTLASDLSQTLSRLQLIRAKTFVVIGETDPRTRRADLVTLSTLNPTVHVRPEEGHRIIHTDFQFVRDLLLSILD